MTNIYAQVQNLKGSHMVQVGVNQQTQSLSIPPKSGGYGSSINGGQLLFLALATCYCNDIYREAAKSGINVQGVEVTVEGDFEGDGLPASKVSYRVRVTSDAGQEEVAALIRRTDDVAEIQNTLRVATPVELRSYEVVSGEIAPR